MANLKASKQGQDSIRQARNDKGWPVDDPRWLVKASEILEPRRNWEVESPPFASGVSEGTWKAFLYRQRGIDTEVFKTYCKVLGLSWEEIREVSNKSLVNQGNSDWQKICRDMLESQKQSIRRQATEIVSEPFYVQLGLVERRHQPRRGSDFSISPEQGSGFFQLDKEEIIETYEHNEFLEQVIKQKQSKKSQGKRIAIIGEPGAGKTTLLESIAFSPKITGCPIWISLGSLGDKSLEEYLCQKWLKDALKTSDVTQQQKQLEELFKSGEVLLLLDGVDEMPAPSPVEALAKIREELTGWVADARVVLTCRVNVWDASVNALQGFDTYRTLEFSYGDGNKPDQVREFICQWFSKAEKPELGELLREKLDEDRHQRIRDLVKNPLRLSLLCQSWYFRQGDLPETKAALYEQFTRAFYDWKQEQFPTTPTQRKELNAALGVLAREAIDKEKSRFGIRESFAIALMGEDLFKLACKLHWLNFVYKDAETGEKVYAFFHPTFQEYFAACAVDDWHFFLNHVANNPAQGMYRIFKPQWKEVILLWLGREEQELRQQKEMFIKALVKFEDGCDGFYRLRAYFLAASGIAEFSDCSCSLVDEILVQLIKWGFGYFNDEKKQMRIFLAPIAKGARVALTETVRTRAIDGLIELLETNESHYDICNVCESLEQIGTGNPQVVAALARVLEIAENEDDRYNLALRLGRIAPGSRNQRAVREILRLIEQTEDKRLRRMLARNLEEIDPGNPRARAELAGVLEKTKENSRHKETAQGSVQIRTDNPQMIAKLLRVLETPEDENTRCIAATFLGEIIPGDPRAIKVLLKALETTENCYAAIGIGKICTANPRVIAALLKAIETTENTKNTILRWLCIESLKKIIQGEYLQSVVLSLRNYITAQIYANRFVRYEYCYEIILHCAQNMNYSDFYYAWHGQLVTVRALENQLIDIASQVQPTDRNYPIAIDTQSLKLESTNAIAQRVCTKIYRKAGYSDIPSVNDAAQLQQYIPRIQEQLHKPNLALILHGCEPTEQLITFCYSLADRESGIYISLITNKPLEQPLKGFLPDRDNLLSAIQTWIDEIS